MIIFLQKILSLAIAPAFLPVVIISSIGLRLLTHKKSTGNKVIGYALRSAAKKASQKKTDNEVQKKIQQQLTTKENALDRALKRRQIEIDIQIKKERKSAMAALENEITASRGAAADEVRERKAKALQDIEAWTSKESLRLTRELEREYLKQIELIKKDLK